MRRTQFWQKGEWVHSVASRRVAHGIKADFIYASTHRHHRFHMYPASNCHICGGINSTFCSRFPSHWPLHPARTSQRPSLDAQASQAHQRHRCHHQTPTGSKDCHTSSCTWVDRPRPKRLHVLSPLSSRGTSGSDEPQTISNVSSHL